MVVLILALGLTDRIMERQARVTKFTRQLTLILLSGLAALRLFVRVDAHLGRVSERGLFHVEIQTEIASPLLVGHRPLSERDPLAPKIDRAVLEHRQEEESVAPADLIFDKAEEAEVDDRAKEDLEALRDALRELEQEAKKAPEREQEELAQNVAALRSRIEVVEAEIEAREEDAELEEGG